MLLFARARAGGHNSGLRAPGSRPGGDLYVGLVDPGDGAVHARDEVGVDAVRAGPAAVAQDGRVPEHVPAAPGSAGGPRAVARGCAGGLTAAARARLDLSARLGGDREERDAQRLATRGRPTTPSAAPLACLNPRRAEATGALCFSVGFGLRTSW